MPISSNDMKDWFGLFPSKSFADGSCHFISGMGNTGVVETDEGLVVFDLPIRQYSEKTFNEVRAITNKQIKYLIYSHGHFDHAFGYEYFINEIKEKKWEMPEVIAHENCLKRFEKYRILNKYHEWINKQQFASVAGSIQDILVSAQETLHPTIIIQGNDSEIEKYAFQLGDLTFKIFHDKGETDDSIWLWVPEKEVIFAGDLMVSSFPNVGNPYKVQRYPKDWAIAMERMMEKDPKYLVPGHGPLIEGKEKVRDVLSITSEAMHFVHDEVVKRLNEGKWFEQIYHELLEICPERFKDHPYLKPMYGCYRFAIHAAYRLYHGWYNTGNPTDLFPAKSDEIAQEFLKLNSENKYLEHATKLFNENKLQLALHVLDIVIKGTEEKASTTFYDALNLKYKILKKIVKEEPSFIASNIINNGANQIKEQMKQIKKIS